MCWYLKCVYFLFSGKDNFEQKKSIVVINLHRNTHLPLKDRKMAALDFEQQKNMKNIKWQKNLSFYKNLPNLEFGIGI